MDMGLSDADEANEVPPATSSVVRQFGDYELLEEVGRGGMGVVYRARQISLNRIVAVKMLVARPFAVPELEERLHLEAEAAARLNHPNIVTIHEFGECDDQFYFSMEYIEGRNLAQLTRHHSLAPTQAAQYVKAVAEAVHHAHEHGILHRDLKPSNILIDRHGQVKVTDFGLAKRLGADSELTLTGQLVGSPNYLSPEQAAGRHRALTVRSDVYSLGAVLYQLLTTRPPLVGESLEETLVQIREKEAPSPRLLSSSVPRDLETICLKCLQKESARRYDSAQALAADLGRFLERKPISARSVSVAGRVWRWCRRKPALAGALAGCALALLVGIFGIAWQWKRAETEARTAQRSLYGADMLLAQQALEQSDVGRTRELLNRHRPIGNSHTSRRLSRATDLCGWEWRYLWSQCQSDEQGPPLFKGSNAITVLAFSADGSQLAVGREPGVVMLWDFPTRRLIAERPASRWAKALAASAPHGLFASGARESNSAPSVVLWDADLQRESARLTHTNDVVSLAFSPDAQWLATLTCRYEVAVWNIASQQIAASCQVQTNFPIVDCSEYACVLFSPTDRLLAIGTKDLRDLPCLHLMDCVRGVTKHVALPAPADAVTAMAFTPDGRWLALGGGYFDNSIHLYEVRTGTFRRLDGHKGWITCLAFGPDGNVLASSSADQTIRLWDLRLNAELARFHGHEDEVYSIAWTPDGRQLVSGSKDGSIRVWDPVTKPTQSTYTILPDQTRDLAFASACDQLVTLGWNRAYRPPASESADTWRHIERSVVVRQPHTLQEVSRLASPGLACLRMALTADSRRLALGDWRGKVEIWDFEIRRPLTNFFVGNGWIRQLEFSHAANRLLCVGECDGGGRVFQFRDATSWVVMDLPTITMDGLYEAALSPDGRILAISYLDGSVTWWDPKTSRRQVRFEWQHLGRHIPMAFSPDGKWFAAGGPCSVLMLVEVASRQTRQIARAHVNQVNALAFSPDGGRLITSGTAGNDTIKIWDVAGGRDIATLAGNPGFYDLVGFSPDGNVLYAVDNRGNALFWRAPTLEDIATREQATTFLP